MKHWFAIPLFLLSFAASSLGGIKADLLGNWQGTETSIENGITNRVVPITVNFSRYEVTGLKMVMNVTYPGLDPAVLTGLFKADKTFRSKAVVNGVIVARTRGTWSIANNIITLILDEPSRTTIRMINHDAFKYVTVYHDGSRDIGRLTRIQ